MNTAGQDTILNEQVMLRATRVDFPPRPVVSEEAKAFIRACLTHSQAGRPDVQAMCALPYLRSP
ncbi:unnamed protein product, partial [Discosporangium mesarthrocarpum]